jgi:hypothetical protein
MFLTEEEAKERLNSERNLLRTGDIRDAIPEQTSSSPKVSGEEDWPEPELDDEIDKIKLPCISTEESLAKLERLIAGGSSSTRDGRAHYAGKREAQKAIAEVDSILGPTVTGAIMGLSPSQSQAYGDGLQSAHTNSDLREDKEIKEVRRHIELVKLDIAVKATSRLRRIVSAMSDTRIDAIESPVILAKVGRDVAGIIEKVSPRELADPDKGSIHVYRPETAEVNDYKVININIGSRAKETLTDTEEKFLKRALDESPEEESA